MIDADFGFFEVQRQAGDAVAEVEHLVEHRIGQAFDLGHAVADFADDADILLRRRVLAPAICASISSVVSILPIVTFASESIFA